MLFFFHLTSLTDQHRLQQGLFSSHLLLLCFIYAVVLYIMFFFFHPNTKEKRATKGRDICF